MNTNQHTILNQIGFKDNPDGTLSTGNRQSFLGMEVITPPNENNKKWIWHTEDDMGVYNEREFNYFHELLNLLGEYKAKPIRT